jgi:hypothetical protein
MPEDERPQRAVIPSRILSGGDRTRVPQNQGARIAAIMKGGRWFESAL